MIPFVDVHCHLLAGYDDGPRTDDEALEMCRIAYAEGTRHVAAGAHQNDSWPDVTPARIRQGATRLAELLRQAGLPLNVFPSAEVMIHADIEAAWKNGELLSVADTGKYLLVELPHGLFMDLQEMVRNFVDMGVRPILAHPERLPELLHEPGQIERLVRAGCLVQVSSKSVTDPANRRDEKALKSWFERGVVHLLGSDGHSPRRRAPLMADAYKRIAEWADTSVADRVSSIHGLAIVQGLSLPITEPKPVQRSWFSRLF